METYQIKESKSQTVSGVAVHKNDIRIRVTQFAADNSLTKITDMKDAVIVTAHCFDNGVDILEF